MHAIILAAGRGSRLAHLTRDNPKCLVEFAGRPLIDGAISSLRAGGVDHITVVGGYRAEMLESRVKKGDIDRLIVNDRWETTNMVASLLLGISNLEGTRVLISYSDLFFGPSIVEDLRQSRGALAVAYDPDGVALWTDRFVNPLDDLENLQIRPDHTLSRIGSKVSSLTEPEGQYMGLLAVSPEAITAIRNVVHVDGDANLDMTTMLQRVIDTGFPVTGVPNREAWGEIDSPEDLDFFTKRATHHG